MSTEWPDQHSQLPPNATEPPPALLRAVQLMYVGAAISLMGAVVNLLDRDGIREQVRETLQLAGEPITEEALSQGMMVATAIGAFFGAVTVALWLWIAASNKKGKSWARILATVFGAISIVLGITGAATTAGLGGGAASVVLTVVGIALAGAILYFLWRPENNPYYAYNSKRR